MKRRDFLAAAACAPLFGCASKAPPLPPGELGGGNFDLGHRLRAPAFAAGGEVRRVAALVIGAGIGGLSAGWRLLRGGCDDFLVLDLEGAAGGNARWGENSVSAHPLGAHYLPLPTREAVAVRALLADLGALHGDPAAARPMYDEALLCHAPHERLYKDGIWQDGVAPKAGLDAGERAEFRRFHEQTAALREARDSQGRRAFAIPAAYSSPEPRWRALDGITMHDWLRAEGYRSAALHWYVDYACRDDYGTDYRQTSAWAGLHYFACRNGEAANAVPGTVLTAAAGNGWIVRRLAQRLGAHLLPGALATHLVQERGGVAVDVHLAAEKRSLRIVAEQAIWCAPLFVLPHVAAGLPANIAQLARGGSYAPWLVANLTLAAPPANGAGAPLAWDNVLYEGAGLGYVVATHQDIRLARGPTVLTYYRALADMAPQAARERLLAAPRAAWAADILAELGRAHADLPALTQRLDVFRHGHAMIRPLPGVAHDPQRRALAGGWGRVQFGHADLSGLSLFEEANYHGVRAAEAVLSRLGQRGGTRLT